MKSLTWVVLLITAISVTASGRQQAAAKKRAKFKNVSSKKVFPVNTQFISRPEGRFLLPTLSFKQIAQLPHFKRIRYYHTLSQAMVTLNRLQRQFGVRIAARERQSNEMFALLLGSSAHAAASGAGRSPAGSDTAVPELVAPPSYDSQNSARGCNYAMRATSYTPTGNGLSGQCEGLPCGPGSSQIRCGVIAGGLSLNEAVACTGRASERNYAVACADKRKQYQQLSDTRLNQQVPNCDNVLRDTNPVGPTGILYCYERWLRSAPFTTRANNNQKQLAYRDRLRACSYHFECLSHLNMMQHMYEENPELGGVEFTDPNYGQLKAQITSAGDYVDSSFKALDNVCKQTTNGEQISATIRRATQFESQVLTAQEQQNLKLMSPTEADNWILNHVVHDDARKGTWYMRREIFRKYRYLSNKASDTGNTYGNSTQFFECEKFNEALTEYRQAFDHVQPQYYVNNPVADSGGSTPSPCVQQQQGTSDNTVVQARCPTGLPTEPPSETTKDFACDHLNNTRMLIDSKVACLSCQSYNDAVARAETGASSFLNKGISNKWMSFMSIAAKACKDRLPGDVFDAQTGSISLKGAVWLRNAYGFCGSAQYDWSAEELGNSQLQSKVRDWRTSASADELNKTCRSGDTSCISFTTVFGINYDDIRNSFCPEALNNADTNDKKFAITRREVRKLRRGWLASNDDSTASALRDCANQAANVADELYAKADPNNLCPAVQNFSTNAMNQIGHPMQRTSQVFEVGEACYFSRRVRGHLVDFLSYSYSPPASGAPPRYVYDMTNHLWVGGSQISGIEAVTVASNNACPDVGTGGSQNNQRPAAVPALSWWQQKPQQSGGGWNAQ